MPPRVTKQNPSDQKPTTLIKTGSVLDRLAPIHVNQKKDTMNIYGVSGTGKTSLACTWPKPLLLIGAEDGTRSVNTVKGVDFVKLRNSGEMVDLLGLLKDIGSSRCMAGKPYQTVVMDTATSLQAMCLKEILGLEELPVQKFWGMATMDQYGQSSMQLSTILRCLLELAESNICHAIILAQQKNVHEGKESEVLEPMVMSALSKSPLTFLNPACDYTVQTFIRCKETVSKVQLDDGTTSEVITKSPLDIEWCLRTRPHPNYYVKFRGPKDRVMPPVIVDPSYEKIHKLID